MGVAIKECRRRGLVTAGCLDGIHYGSYQWSIGSKWQR